MIRNAAWHLVDHVDRIFLRYGAPNKISSPPAGDLESLKRRAASAGAKFIDIRQRHIGSDNSVALISEFKKDLESKGIHFSLTPR